MSTTCSCTECVYNPTANKQKSKIDKLYRSKYLPRRKKALLEQLIKTRAAYDDLRDQILSGNTDDIDSEYGSYRSDDFDDPEKSVVKIVDLVDKGKFPLLRSSVNLHSECCECCYCSSKIKLNKHRQAHHALPTDTQLRKSLKIRKHKARKDRNAVQFRAVRSEPCICTSKFSDLKNIPRKIRHISSKEIFKRKSKKQQKSNKPPVECECIVDDDELGLAIETQSKLTKTRNRIRESLRSFQTHVTSKEIFKRKSKGFIEPVECECIGYDDEYSIESPSKFKKTRDKIKNSLRSIETSSKELYQKLKQKRSKNEIVDFEFFDEYYKKPSLAEKSKMKIKLTRDKFKDGIRLSVSKFENAFRIKKDSIMLFREKLKRKKALKPWTCDPDFCTPNMEKCIAEECYEKIKVREAKRMKEQQVGINKPEVESYQSQVSVISFKINPKPQKEELRVEAKRKSRKDNVICECGTKTRSKSSMTHRRRRRTQKSMSDSIITSYNKKTDTLSEGVSDQKYNSQYSMIESDAVTNLPNATSKQAVKISSSFKFEIEFYKDKVPSVQKESNRTKREKDSQNHHKHYSSAGENDKVLKYSNARAQHTIRMQKRSAQTIDISSAEKLPFSKECEPYMCVPGKCDPKKCAAILLKQSQGNHELQRCFCTLHLQETPKRQDKKYSMTRPIKLEQRSNSISTQTIKNLMSNTGHTQNVLPYECEPHVCIPGECNPIICYERIKKRSSIKNRSINTPTQRTERRDVKSSSATKSRSVGTKVRASKQRKRLSRQKSELPSVPVEKSLSSSTTLNRQVVRIGSSFKFDVEFYKNTNNLDENISVPNDNREKIINSSSLHSKDSNSTKSEHADVRKSFLKRCFCTEQFRKKPKEKQIKRRSTKVMTDIKKKKSRQYQTKVVQCECDHESEKPLVKTRASMASTVVNYVKPPVPYQNRNLLPYECEPFFCTPGKCDPYVCLQRIKSRNIKRIKTQSKHIGTMSKKTTSAVTSIGNQYSSRKVQAAKRKKVGHNVGIYDRRVQRSNVDKTGAYISKSLPSPPKQGVRIGSSFRFDIEFYKVNKFLESTILEKKGENKTNLNFEGTNVKKLKLKTRGVGDYAEVRSQTTGTKDTTKSNISLTKPLQRCFCTLKFGKKPKQKVEKSVSKTTATNHIRMVKCECKVASTQTPKQTGKSKLYEDKSCNVAMWSNLLPYECEPNFCVPGKCDPYTCFERIKSRNLLKKCFCTLKLQKSSKNRGSTTHLKKVKRTAGTETVQDKHWRHNLLPYECSPGVCDVGKCNPYKCLELIKKRNAINISHRDQFVSTYEPVKKSSFSETPKTGKRSQSTLNTSEHRARKDKNSKSRKDRHRKQNNVLNDRNTLSNASLLSSCSKPRQAVRIGSNFTFNIEFSKNKAGKFVSASDKKNPQVSSTHIDQSTKIESKRARCFCTLKFHKKGKRNGENRFNNNLEISIKERKKRRKPGIREAMEVTREKHYKRHRRQRPQGQDMINITEKKRYGKQKQTQKPPVLQPKESVQQETQKLPVEQPKATVQQPQETVLITRQLKEIKPEPPPVQYEYVYRTVKYTGEGNTPVVTEVNASQVDVNKLVATGQIPAK